MSYYCLISGDLSKEAFQVFRKRISEQKWPLYEKTKHINKDFERFLCTYSPKVC